MVTRSFSELDDDLINMDFEKTENVLPPTVVQLPFEKSQQESLVIDNNNL